MTDYIPTVKTFWGSNAFKDEAMKFNHNIEVWLGDERSSDDYQAFLNKSMDVNLLVRSNPESYDSDSDSILTKYGSVGVVNITGTLLPTSTWVSRMFGLVGYPDIRDALITAAQDDSITHILLNIGSSGGSTTGVGDISDLILEIRRIKPVIAYTNSEMASAAYWIGVTAEKVYASRLAVVGSIGVIGVHFDRTQALANEGVKPTVFRAGEYKGLGGSFESLSSLAISTIDAQLQNWYNEFINHVSVARGVKSDTVRVKMADGKEFLGFEALEVGLIDGITTIDDLMLQLNSAGQGTSGIKAKTRMEANSMSQKLLTEQQIAALAAGGVQARMSANANADADAATGAEIIENPDAGVVNPEGVEDAGGEGEGEGAVKPTFQASTVTQSQDVSGGLADYLKTELAASNEKLLQASMEARNLQAKLDSVNATHSQLREIVSDYTNNKRIALNMPSIDLSMSTDEGLIQSYQHVNAEFGKQFKVGRQTILASSEPPVEAVVDDAHMARIQATRVKAKKS